MLLLVFIISMLLIVVGCILSGNANQELLISNEEYKNIIKELIQESKNLKINFRTGDPTLIPIFPEVFGIDIKEAEQYYAGCEAGDEIIYIDFKGNVGACSYIPIFADNVKDKPVDEILKTNQLFISLKQYKENLKGKCKECTYKMICGGCRATAYAFKNSLFEEDPLCLLEERRRFYEKNCYLQNVWIIIGG